MLNRLVRRAVFAQADAVVGEHMDHALLHERRHADGVAAVVAEGQEGAAVGNKPTMQRHTVHDGSHAEFAHAVVDVASTLAGFVFDHGAVRIDAEVGGGRRIGQVGAGQVGRAAQQLGQSGSKGFQRQLRGLARGHGLGFGVGSDHGVHRGLHKVLGQRTTHAAQQFFGQCGVGFFVGSELGVPGFFARFASRFGVPVGVHRFGYDERWRCPANGFAGELDFLGAQGLAVGFGGVGAVGAAFADGGFANNQRGLVAAGFGAGNGGRHSGGVMAVHGGNHVPAVSGKTLGRVVDKPGCNLAVDGNAVVVVQGDELVELPGACQRTRFVADAFHQATVAQEHIGVVVHHGVAFAVELTGQQLFCQRHAHRIGNALAQWAGGGFHAGRDTHFGVACGFAVQLTEVFQLFHGQLVACEVQQRINQHGAMAVGQHKAVTVEPMRVGGVVLQVLAPEGYCHIGHAHGRAGVTGVGVLNCVHGKRADCACHLLGMGHGESTPGWGGLMCGTPAGRCRRGFAHFNDAPSSRLWPM